MDTLLLKMAQRASDDSSLMASLIQVHARQHELTWSQVAAELTLDEEQLARLALCRRPNGQSTSDEIQQMAAYVDMSSTELTTFIRRNSNSDTQTAARPLPAPTQPKRQRDSFVWPSFKWERNPMVNRRTISFALAAIVFMAFAAFAFAQPSGSEATLVVSAGQATVQQGETMFLIVPRQTQTTVAAGSILTVNQGDRITVPDGSAAQLNLYDGSIVEMAGGSTLEISELVTNGRTYRVQLSLVAGRTLNRVVKLLGADDKFEVRTPSSTASVRGTIFTVAALSGTESYIAVDEGIVRVTLGGEFIDVYPGQAVMAVVGQPLSLMGQTPDNPANAPAAQPASQTPVQNDDSDDADSDGDADSEALTDTPATEPPVMAPPATTAVPGVPLDTPPIVTGTVPTVTPAPGTCADGEIQPTALTLAQRYDVTYEEIMGWFCARFGFGEIDRAYSLSQETGATVAEIFSKRANGMGWGQIRDVLMGENGDNGNSGNNGNNGNSNNGNNNGGNNNNGNNGNNGNSGNGGQSPPEPPPAPPPEPPPPPDNSGGNNGSNNGNNGNGNNGNNGNGGNR